jgi:cytochrome c-type biogenesis protein CcmF
MGIGPLARWKQATLPELGLRLRWALAVSVVTALLLPLVAGRWTPMISLGLLLAFWILTTAAENLRGRLAGLSGGLAARLRGQPRGYFGMLAAHCGVAVFIVGVTLVKGYEIERDLRMAPGDSVTVSGYTFRFDGAQSVSGPNYRAARGSILVTRGDRQVVVLKPEKRLYNVQQNTMTEAAINTSPLRDLYVSLGDPLEDGAWTVRIYYKPFVVWIWAGCAIMALGGLLALSDRRYRGVRRRVVAADTPRIMSGVRPT